MTWAWSSPHRALASALLLLASTLCVSVSVAQPVIEDDGDERLKVVNQERTAVDDSFERPVGASLDSGVIVPGMKTFLEPNFPNPFSFRTSIGYTVAEETTVELKVYDFNYREVATLVDGERKAPGRYVATFVPEGLPSAMYFYELRTSQGVEQRRMLYVK